MDRLRVLLLGLPRRQKRTLQVIADVVLVTFALWMAFVVRLGVEDLINPLREHTWSFYQRSAGGHSSVHTVWHVPCRHALFWQ